MDENQVGKKRRTRRTGKEVQRLVEEFISGGMKRSEFCRTRGLSPGTLQRHLKGGKQRARQIPRLVAVELEQKAAQKANAIEVVLARGRRVEVRPGFDATTLQALIAVLERV
jgi:predicted transcriptional regulator